MGRKSNSAGNDILPLEEIIKNFRQNNVKPYALETDYHFKFSIPVANFVFAMVALFFSAVSPRKENAFGVIFAILCIAVSGFS